MEARCEHVARPHYTKNTHGIPDHIAGELERVFVRLVLLRENVFRSRFLQTQPFTVLIEGADVEAE